MGEVEPEAGEEGFVAGWAGDFAVPGGAVVGVGMGEELAEGGIEFAVLGLGSGLRANAANDEFGVLALVGVEEVELAVDAGFVSEDFGGGVAFERVEKGDGGVGHVPEDLFASEASLVPGLGFGPIGEAFFAGFLLADFDIVEDGFFELLFSVVEDADAIFSEVGGGVAEFFGELGEGGFCEVVVTVGGFEPEMAGAVRVATIHHGSAAGAAAGRIAIGAGEESALGGELIGGG